MPPAVLPVVQADPQDRREKTSFFNWWACFVHHIRATADDRPVRLSVFRASKQDDQLKLFCSAPALQVLLLRQHRQPAGGDRHRVGAGALAGEVASLSLALPCRASAVLCHAGRSDP